MIKSILITGGARSGKSTFAEELSIEINSSTKNKIAYIATAEVTDDEFKDRIRKHQERRGDEYKTYECPINITSLISDITDQHNVVIIECLATWLGNIYYKFPEKVENKIEDELKKIVFLLDIDRNKKSLGMIDQLKNNLKSLPAFEELFQISNEDKTIIFVTNEVGTGIVPDNKLARSYRDNLGLINKTIASVSDYVFSCTCGIPTRIK